MSWRACWGLGSGLREEMGSRGWSGFGLRERRGIGLQRFWFGRELGADLGSWATEMGAGSREKLVRSGGAGGVGEVLVCWGGDGPVWVHGIGV